MIKSPIWQRNFASSGAIRLALVLGLNMVSVQSHADLALTGDEKRNYIASLDTPQVQAIREYVNNCLSGVGEMG